MLGKVAINHAQGVIDRFLLKCYSDLPAREAALVLRRTPALPSGHVLAAARSSHHCLSHLQIDRNCIPCFALWLGQWLESGYGKESRERDLLLTASEPFHPAPISPAHLRPAFGILSIYRLTGWHRQEEHMKVRSRCQLAITTGACRCMSRSGVHVRPVGIAHAFR